MFQCLCLRLIYPLCSPCNLWKLEIFRTCQLIQLKNGKEFEFEGEKIKSPPASIMEKIAKGICFQEKLNMELAEAQYKNAIVGMSAIQAELNGYQSIYKHLEQRG